MASTEKTSFPEKPRNPSLSETTVAVVALQRFFDRYKGNIVSDPTFESGTAEQVRSLGSLEPEDVVFTLESAWPKSLDEQRRDVLMAAHREIKGEPGVVKIARAQEITLGAAFDSSVLIQDAIKNPKDKDHRQIAMALDYIENKITDESVTTPTGSLLEALRTTRDELHKIHKDLLEQQREEARQARHAEQQRRSASQREKAVTAARSEVDTVLNKTDHTSDEDPGLTKMLGTVPDTVRELIRFDNMNFKGLTPGEIDAKIPLLRAYMVKQLKAIVAQQQEGLTYKNSVVGVMGNGGGAVDAVKYLLEQAANRKYPYNTFLTLPFSEVAKSFNIDVKRYVPDFEARFSS